MRHAILINNVHQFGGFGEAKGKRRIGRVVQIYSALSGRNFKSRLLDINQRERGRGEGEG